jgi:RimJ/RimL family protein N-acetyltransferase
MRAIHECPTNHPALAALFDPTLADHVVLWAVLKGRHTGRAWVDDVHYPSQCVLRTDALLTYSSHDISPAFLAAAIAHVRQKGPLWLVASAEMDAPLGAPQATHIAQRLEFLDCDPDSAVLAELRQRLPAGFEMRRIDRALLERCEWRADMEFFCGSLDTFLAQDLGLCMMRGDEIIVEAYASSFGETHAEIGAVTREPHRGRGYAPIACAYLIEAVAQRGYQPYWSCDRDNTASIRVARKLGFRAEKPYRILEYSAIAQ